MASLNISLPDALRAWVDTQVETGDYANASDYMRDLIRHDQERREWLRRALVEGEESGLSTATVEDIVARVDAETKRGA